MKKVTYKIISIMTLTVCLLLTNKTHSQEVNLNQKTFIVTKKPDNNIINYAKNTFKMLVDKKYINSETNKLVLCNPFLTTSNESNDYRFLIKDDKNIISSLVIINDKNSKNLKWQLNEGKMLNAIKEKISKGGVYNISFKKNTTKEYSDIILQKLSHKEDLNLSSITDELASYKNDDFITKKLREPDYPLPYPDERILSLNPKEVQTNNPWCAAYVGSTILSHGLGKDIRAYDIMKWAYPGTSYSSLLNKSISDSKLISYAKTVGSNPYYVNYALSRTEIMDEILARRMIYAGCKNVYSNNFHAMLVYGYKKDVSYNVWNPWGERYVIPMSSSDIYADDDSHYYWVDSITHWSN